MIATLAQIKKAVAQANITEAVVASRSSPIWRGFWYRVRLNCGRCDAYLVLPQNPAHKQFPFCALKCGFTMSKPDFLRRKTSIVRYLCTNEDRGEEIWPYVILDKPLPKGAAEP